MPDSTTIPVRLGDRTYEVAIGRDLLTQAAARLSDALGYTPTKALVVADTGAQPHVDRIVASLAHAGIEAHRIDITPTERTKTIATFAEVLQAAANAGLERAHPIIAVGGGIVGDVAGFAASAYRRGVPSVVCPTTLLSMVDASVGGKTGVNLTAHTGGLIKNMAGAFHQPSLVLADLDTLATLDARHRTSGLAECVKHAMLSADHDDPDALDWLRIHADALAELEPAAMDSLVTRSVQLKARVVEHDERELAAAGSAHGRATLNLGHTFAHAIEPIEHLSPTGKPGDAPLHHGEAVALGLVAACATAAAAGLCEPSYGDSVSTLLNRLGLPIRVEGLPANDELRARMLSDKKVAQGAIRLVLPTAPGSARLIDDCPANAIDAGWDRIRA